MVTAVVDRVVPTPSGYALWGNLEGIDLGTLTLVVNGTVVTGTVRSPGGTYVIEPSGDGFAVRQVDLSREARSMNRCRGHRRRTSPSPLPGNAARTGARPEPASTGPASSGPAPPRTTPDDGSVIDLLVLYTAAARQGAGGTAQIEADIDLRVAETNQAYAASRRDPAGQCRLARGSGLRP